MIGANITKDLGDNNFEIHVDPVDTNKDPILFGVCHDYALFSTYTSLTTVGGLMIKSPRGHKTNLIDIKASVQIPIRAMAEVVLPKLIESEYLKEDHYSKMGVWSNNPVRHWADSKTVHIFDKGANKFIELSVELYEKLTNK